MLRGFAFWHDACTEGGIEYLGGAIHTDPMHEVKHTYVLSQVCVAWVPSFTCRKLANAGFTRTNDEIRMKPRVTKM